MATLKRRLPLESDQDVQEPIDRQVPICLRRYVPWVMEQHDKEHVSFASFVEKFKLSDLPDAQATFEALINSTHLKTRRQQSLRKAYDTFAKHNMQGFWSNRMLEMERRETKINFDIVATKTARIAQNASLSETTKAAELSDDKHQGGFERSAQSKREVKQGSSSKNSNKRAKAGDVENTDSNDDVITLSNSLETMAESGDDACSAGPATEPRPYFDLQSARRIKLVIEEFSVGATFRLLQEEATPFINNEGHKVSIKKLHMILSANSIWDTSERLPGMSTDVHRRILSQIKPIVIRLPAEKTQLILDLSHELATTGCIRSRAFETEEDEDLLHLFKDLSKSLPHIALHAMVDNEDTYSHGALHSLMLLLFPSSDSDLHLSWANRPSQGSRERRGDANKPFLHARIEKKEGKPSD